MNPINLDNIVKYPLNGQCRICDKDFYTKFDGKVFHSYGAVCHEICVVSIIHFINTIIWYMV